jgi:hypothetical protein
MDVHRISLGSVEDRNPVSSQLAGFRFLFLLIISLRSHAAQSLALLLLTINFAVQSAECGSNNDTNNFL